MSIVQQEEVVLENTTKKSSPQISMEDSVKKDSTENQQKNPENQIHVDDEVSVNEESLSQKEDSECK